MTIDEKLRNAKNTMANIKYKVEQLEKEKCEQDNGRGSSVCDNLLLVKYKKEIKKNMKDTDDSIKKTIELMKIYKANNERYGGKNGVTKVLKDFYNEKENYYKLTEGNLEELEKKSAISNRMTNFYSKKTENIIDISFYLKILYWILFIVIIAIMIIKRQYKDIKYWPMVIVLVLFPLIFMKSIIFQFPFVNKQMKISSVFDYLYEKFEHFNVDNIYLISFIVISVLITIYTMISLLPFNMKEIIE